MATQRTFAHAFYCQILSFFTLLLVTTNLHADPSPKIIVIPYAANHSPTSANFYFEEVLKLAIEKTAKQYGTVHIQEYPYLAGRERQRLQIKTDTGLDILWSATSPEREQQLMAIKFNLLRELSDYKILLIRQSDAEHFANVKSVADLRKFKAGTGTHWQDTQILKKNDLPFMTSWNYEPMFKMLAVKRFDYMVRGAQEIWGELEQHQNQGFMIEQHLLIHYSLPVYFFVNPKNIELAERLKTGLEIAEHDGSLDKLFYSIPGFQRAHDEIHNKQRRVIEFVSNE